MALLGRPSDSVFIVSLAGSLLLAFICSIWRVTSLEAKKVTSYLSFLFYFQALHFWLLISFLFSLSLKHDVFSFTF